MGKKIILLVGTKLSGKGEIVKILQKRGYEYFSLSDSLRRYADKIKTSKEIFELQELGNALRKKEGNDIIAKLTLKEIGDPKGRGLVIDGVRHPGELKFLRKNLKNTILIAVDAEPRLRFKRVKKRKRMGDPETWEEFQRMDKRESWGAKKSSGLQVKRTMKLAEVAIQNNSTISELKQNLERVLKETQ